jgi:chemotaxis protein methyltransferase CheR
MIEVGINDLKSVISAVKEQYQYDFSEYALSSFKRRIERLIEIRHYSSVEELVQQIRGLKLTKDEFLHEITVNVTEMFRDPSFWRAAREFVSKIIQEQGRIRIWHAGCSSGEEVVSMLILLDEYNLLDKAEIVASDIDSAILAKARAGKFSVRNMDLNEKNYQRYHQDGDIKKYFSYNTLTADFDPKLLARVSFREIDLVKAQPFNKFDLVLCRNVMIYFNQYLQNKVLKLFSDCMFKNAHLAIGSKESIAWCDIATNFQIVNAEEKVYKKIKE